MAGIGSVRKIREIGSLGRLTFRLPSTSVVFTTKGTVRLEGPVGPLELRGYHLDEGLKKFRPAAKQLKALVGIAGMPESFVYIARHEKTVVGYVTFLPPDIYLCWGTEPIPGVLELGVIEASPEWRRMGIGSQLLREAFGSGKFEDYLIISMEFAWHWDLNNSGLSLWKYRKMLTGFLAGFGFELWHTNDPDILSHPANTFMVRTGKKVSQERIDRLRKLCTQIKP